MQQLLRFFIIFFTANILLLNSNFFLALPPSNNRWGFIKFLIQIIFSKNCCWNWIFSLQRLMFESLLFSEAKDITLFPHLTHLLDPIFHRCKSLSFCNFHELFWIFFFFSKVQRMSCVGPLSLPHVTTSATSIGRWIMFCSKSISIHVYISCIWRFSFPAKSTLFANLSFYSNNPDTFSRLVMLCHNIDQDVWWFFFFIDKYWNWNIDVEIKY